MQENFENQSRFKLPNIENERGEFERVAQKFQIDSSVLMFLAREGQLVQLTESLLSNLENTDACDIEKDDFETLDRLLQNNSSFHQRDWRDLYTKLTSGTLIDAPIVMKYGNRYHLVSGNTRLMVARVLGITPQILLFTIEGDI